jgi:zinc transport system substrate-binding protein
MKKILILLLLLSTYIFSNINAVVSILPLQTFLQAIGGDKINITLMVQAGNSPHTYEPKPSQMVSVAKADVYMTIGVEFEKVWLPKFTNLNSKMQVLDLTKGIKKIPMDYNHHVHEKKEAHKSLDPHVWTNPSNVKIIAQNIYKALLKADSVNQAYYQKNLETFLVFVEQTDTQIHKILSTLIKQNRSFMVFHPSWGYFAKTYNLEQIAVEMEGKSPNPREFVNLIKKAKVTRVKAIFTQPEFSDSSAKIIAHELNIPVLKISPMNPKWSENLVNLAKTIAGQK